ncbi:hypothetical protein MPER_09440, partial [Moniliophthora perniciosa FA553]
MQATNNDPLQSVARLDRLYATEKSSKRKKTIELAGNMVSEAIKANLGLAHALDMERYRNFYNVIEEILKVLENPHNGRFQRLTTFAQDKTITRKLKKAYASLRLPEPRSSKLNVAFTIVDHTATAPAIVSEAVPVMAPGKAVAVALAKIIELAKIAQSNKDEALRLSKHAEDVSKQLFKRLDGAKDLSPETLADIEEDLQPLQSVLDEILSALQWLQKPMRNRFKAIFFAKDHKDDLGQLQRKLDDAFRVFSASNDLAARIVAE